MHHEEEDVQGTSTVPTLYGSHHGDMTQIVPVEVEGGDVSITDSIVPYGSTHSMITRLRTRNFDETMAGTGKKPVVASYEVGTKRQRMTQESPKANVQQIAIYGGGQVMAATEEVPRSYPEATTDADCDEWEKAIASELESLTANKTWKLVPRPAHQRPIGCCWLFALKQTYAPVAYLNSIRAKLAKCAADGFEIEQCDVDTAFLYGKLNEEIYMELPDGLRELIALAEAEGEDDVVCLLLQSLYGLKQASRVWNETIDNHLKNMGFKAVDADPCAYTSDEGDGEYIVCLYLGDVPIAAKAKTIIASVKAAIAEKFKIKDLGRARFILGIMIDYDIECRALRISQNAYAESIIKKFGQANVKPCLQPLQAGVHFTKVDQPQTGANKAKMSSKPYRSLEGSLMYLESGTRSDISIAVAQLSRITIKDVGLTYDGRQGTQLVAYADADWVGNRDSTVALSSTDAEYMALRDIVKEVVWVRLLLKDIGSEQEGGSVIYEDNQGAMVLAKNTGSSVLG
ncbi:hypothetical protein PC120_g23423 [Phytophthora cactorum]|nr:hypothetical protein PC120_g23423 [Phytophthora cactorum]